MSKAHSRPPSVKKKTVPPKEETRKKASYVGVPAIYKLELAARHVRNAYVHYDKNGHVGMYLVGSALSKPDWRDVDVVLILDDKSFYQEFPGAYESSYEWHDKWILHCIALSEWLSRETGLPIDFKIQPMTWANNRHEGIRHPLGRRFTLKEEPEE